MKTSVTINIDNDLLNFAANYLGNESTTTDYSTLIEKALLYVLNLRFTNTGLKQNEPEIISLLKEPKLDIETLDRNYHFNLAEFEGKWSGNESVEQLMSLLSK